MILELHYLHQLRYLDDPVRIFYSQQNSKNQHYKKRII